MLARGGLASLRESLEARWAAPARRKRPPPDQAELVRAGSVLFGVGRGVLEAPSLLGGD